jgi:ubiquinone/menaquinone biosynthesis C-methylase UbiE
MRDLVRETYYQDRAAVYDATSYRGDPVVNAGLDRETAEIGGLLRATSGGRVLDVGCGTGVWTQFLRGDIVALDQSAEMLVLARDRVPHAGLVHALFPPLPFAAEAFDILFTGNFYGLLREAERRAFLAEAGRVARELIVLDLRSDYDAPMEGIELRSIGNGATYPIFRRRFTPESLRAELNGELLYPGRYFLVTRTKTEDLPK